MCPHRDPNGAALADRPAWQVLALALVVVAGTLLAIVLVVAVASVTASVSPLSGRAHAAVVGLPVVVGLYEGARRLVGVPVGWFRARRPDRRIVAWAAPALAFPAVVLSGQLQLFGAARVGELPDLHAGLVALAGSLLAGLLAGVLEELSLRGALLRLLEARWGQRAGVAGTAAVFAALHQGHAGSRESLALVLASMAAAGLLLGVVVVRSGSVWAAVTVHAGWNTAFGGGLVAAGAPGRPVSPALLQYRLPADSLLAGGEASLAAAPLTTAALLAATLFVALAPRRWIALDRPREEPAAVVRR